MSSRYLSRLEQQALAIDDNDDGDLLLPVPSPMTTSPLSPFPRHSSFGSSTGETDFTQFSFPFAPSTATTFTPPSSRRPSDGLSKERCTRITLHPYVTISFIRGSRLFKLRYSYIDIFKEVTGDLKVIELGDHVGGQSPFIHTFPNSRKPIPHLERPTASHQHADLRVSFLDEQTVQAANTVFSAQPIYKFESPDDCTTFQEVLMGQSIIFTTGVAEVRSKGRGEECISQNLRICRAANGSLSLVLFANSQRKEKKRYLAIPAASITNIQRDSRPSRPTKFDLRPDNDLLVQLHRFTILFLDKSDETTFFNIISSNT